MDVYYVKIINTSFQINHMDCRSFILSHLNFQNIPLSFNTQPVAREVIMAKFLRMQKYILIGTSLRFYTNESKREEICEQYNMYSTGIKEHNFKNKSAVDEMSPFEIVIMEGSCWTQPAETFAYGCLTGVFVNSWHTKKLEESNIKWVAGGFLGETDTRSIAPQIEKFAWGTAELSLFDKQNYVTVGSFYSKGDGGPRYVYVHMNYNSREQPIISHVWHGEDLVLGDPSTDNMSSRNVKVVASQILESFYGEKLTTFSISFSSTWSAAPPDMSPTYSWRSGILLRYSNVGSSNGNFKPCKSKAKYTPPSWGKCETRAFWGGEGGGWARILSLVHLTMRSMGRKPMPFVGESEPTCGMLPIETREINSQVS